MAKQRSKSPEKTRQITEALLFAAHEPLTARRMADIIEGVGVAEVRKAIEELKALYDEQARAFQVHEIAGGYQLFSRPEYRKYVQKLRRTRGDGRLTQAALETLAIVAWKQPIIRADIEAIRGVQSGEMLRHLAERGLVKIVGRLDVIGRPLLYGTTKKFLQHFGLKSLKEMPKLGELHE